jgi:hypothetical protein
MSVQETLAQIVHDAGYIVAIDGASVSFKVEGVLHHFELFGDDTEYARLVISYALPKKANASVLSARANEQNQKSKAVKTSLYPAPTNGYVSFSIEMFFSDVMIWEPVLERSIAALSIASDEFFEAVKRPEAVAS